MTGPKTTTSNGFDGELRVWPVLISVLVQTTCLVLSTTPSINNAARFVFMLAGPAVGLALYLGWLLPASGLPWIERVSYVGITVGLGFGVVPLVHPTATLGLLIYGIPLITLVVPIVVILTKQQPKVMRISAVSVGLAVAWSVFALLRIEGFTGRYLPEIAWRWLPTSEQTLLDEMKTPAAPLGEPWEPRDALWPGFRGPARNGRAEDHDKPLDWNRWPPKPRWRIPIGPGWSSFAFVSGRLFTQQQRGKREAVSCYDAESGDLIWIHTDPLRHPPRSRETPESKRAYPRLPSSSVLARPRKPIYRPAASRTRLQF